MCRLLYDASQSQSTRELSICNKFSDSQEQQRAQVDCESEKIKSIWYQKQETSSNNGKKGYFYQISNRSRYPYSQSRSHKIYRIDFHCSLLIIIHQKDSLRRCKGDPSCAQKKKLSTNNFQQWMQCVCTHHGATADEALVLLYGRDWNGRSIASMAKNGNIIFFVPAEKIFVSWPAEINSFILFLACSAERERCCRKVLKFTRHRRHQISIRTVRGRERGDSLLDLFNVRYFLARSVNLEDAKIMCRCRIRDFLVFFSPSLS